MGVPKFFRYISERYPCLNDVMSKYEIPEFDNLYLDMNGIIHNCSHGDEDVISNSNEEQIFKDIFAYVEMMFKLIQPKKLFMIAVDGVAPRAKMNQQRAQRFRSAKLLEKAVKKYEEAGGNDKNVKVFDSNCITPGTEFMARLHQQLKYFIVKKISTDKLWQKPKILYSGSDVLGEGEHKIMDYIRYLKTRDDWDPNTRHCLHGLDADLIMLGLCTHDPNFSLLIEEILFHKQKRPKNPEEITFYLLHLATLRDYIDLEFQVLKTTLPFPYDLEKLIDDWVLLGFLVGTDFIPNIPTLYISKIGLNIIYEKYIEVLPTLGGYINEAGTLNLERFEQFLAKLSEWDFNEFKENHVFLSKLNFKEGGLEGNMKIGDNGVHQLIKETDMLIGDASEDETFDDIFKVKSYLKEDLAIRREYNLNKKAYYEEKFELHSLSTEQLLIQAVEYVKGIVWILNYYYNGCPSWAWFYPFHYTPQLSDIHGFSKFDFSFADSTPFRPFEQLLAILPAASKELLPLAFQDLVSSEKSPIISYYPDDFEIDMDGKLNEWEAIILIPFINEEKLFDAMKACLNNLTLEENERNKHGPMYLYQYTPENLGKFEAPEYFPDVTISHAQCTKVWREEVDIQYKGTTDIFPCMSDRHSEDNSPRGSRGRKRSNDHRVPIESSRPGVQITLRDRRQQLISSQPSLIASIFSGNSTGQHAPDRRGNIDQQVNDPPDTPPAQSHSVSPSSGNEHTRMSTPPHQVDSGASTGPSISQQPPSRVIRDHIAPNTPIEPEDHYRALWGIVEEPKAYYEHVNLQTTIPDGYNLPQYTHNDADTHDFFRGSLLESSCYRDFSLFTCELYPFFPGNIDPWLFNCAYLYAFGRFLQETHEATPSPDVVFAIAIGETLAPGIPQTKWLNLNDSRAKLVITVKRLLSHPSTPAHTGLLPEWQRTAGPVLGQEGGDLPDIGNAAWETADLSPQMAMKILVYLGIKHYETWRTLKLELMVTSMIAVVKKGNITRGFARKVIDGLYDDLNVRIELTQANVATTSRAYSSYLNSAIVKTVVEDWLSWLQVNNLTLRLILQQCKWTGLIGYTTIIRAVNDYPDFPWDKLANVARYADEMLSFLIAREIIHDDPYYGYNQDIKDVSIAKYRNLATACMILIRRASNNHQYMSGAKCFRSNPTNPSAVHRIINNYLNEPFGRELEDEKATEISDKLLQSILSPQVYECFRAARQPVLSIRQPPQDPFCQSHSVSPSSGNEHTGMSTPPHQVDSGASAGPSISQQPPSRVIRDHIAPNTPIEPEDHYRALWGIVEEHKAYYKHENLQTTIPYGYNLPQYTHNVADTHDFFRGSLLESSCYRDFSLCTCELYPFFPGNIDPWLFNCAYLYAFGRFLQETHEATPSPDVVFAIAIGETLAPGIPQTKWLNLNDSRAKLVITVKRLLSHTSTPAHTGLLPEWLRTAGPVLGQEGGDLPDIGNAAWETADLSPQMAMKILLYLGIKHYETRRTLKLELMVTTVIAVVKKGNITHEFARKIIDGLYDDLNVRIELTQANVATTSRAYSSYLNSAIVKTVVEDWLSWIPERILTLRLIVQQCKWTGLIGYTTIIRAVTDFPDFPWDKLANVAGYADEMLLFLIAREIIHDDPYYGYNQDIKDVSIAKYRNLATACMILIRRAYNNHQYMSGAKCFRSNPSNPSAVHRIIDNYLNKPFGRELEATEISDKFLKLILSPQVYEGIRAARQPVPSIGQPPQDLFC